MAMRDFFLTGNEWVQFTNGGQRGTLQVKRGVIALCESDSKPGGDEPYFSVRTEAIVTPPDITWIRSPDAHVTASVRDA